MNRRPIFDAVRAILGRGFRQDEAAALDAACDAAEAAIFGSAAPSRLVGRAGSSAPAPHRRKVSRTGIDFIKSFEGCEKDLPNGSFQAYPDPGSADGHPWTIGWGSTGKHVKRGTVWTRQ